MKHIEKSTETLTSLMRDNDDTGEHSTEILCKKKSHSKVFTPYAEVISVCVCGFLCDDPTIFKTYMISPRRGVVCFTSRG